MIFDDQPSATQHHTVKDDEYTAFSNPCHFLAHLLSFLETPAHLRKALFPMHPNLRTAGTLPSLDMPHHLRSNEWCNYREGVTTTTSDTGTFVEVGLSEPKLLDGEDIPTNVRVTVRLEKDSSRAEAVAPSTPRELEGLYWGYTVRRCTSLSAVFTECEFDGGYDVSYGTSERGLPLNKVQQSDPPNFNHMLVVFGGVAGLETAAKNDPELQKSGIGSANVGELFDHWVNVLPGQGSRTIRTEEAVWLGLMGLRNIVENNGHG